MATVVMMTSVTVAITSNMLNGKMDGDADASGLTETITNAEANRMHNLLWQTISANDFQQIILEYDVCKIIEYHYVLDSARSRMNMQNSIQPNAAQCNSMQLNAHEITNCQPNSLNLDLHSRKH